MPMITISGVLYELAFLDELADSLMLDTLKYNNISFVD